MSTFVPRHHQPQVDGPKVAQYRFGPSVRRFEVAEVVPLSKRMVRVRFTGEDLATLATVSPLDHCKLIFDWNEDGSAKLPDISAPWNRAEYTMRVYSIRAFDPEKLLLDVDFVIHEHGVAGRWAATVKPGDRLGMMGPGRSTLIKDVFPWYVLAADETALPALARWVEMLRPGVSVTAFIEVQDADDEISLESAADLTVHWLHRGEREPGTTTLLADAVMAHEFPNRDGYVWVAGEAMGIKELRGYLGRELGLDPENWKVDGYWRRGVANHDHHGDGEGGRGRGHGGDQGRGNPLSASRTEFVSLRRALGGEVLG